jgi:hypothetical protein
MLLAQSVRLGRTELGLLVGQLTVTLVGILIDDEADPHVRHLTSELGIRLWLVGKWVRGNGILITNAIGVVENKGDLLEVIGSQQWANSAGKDIEVVRPEADVVGGPYLAREPAAGMHFQVAAIRCRPLPLVAVGGKIRT